jgi:hypothetical protein
MKETKMNIVFKESALKHGLNKEQLIYGISNIVKSRRVYNKNFDTYNYWAICILPSGATCELAYMYHNFETMIVFHAMSPARNSFVRELEKE